jgi:hypothetical protein
MRWTGALMSEKNCKEEWDVSGRLWHDNDRSFDRGPGQFCDLHVLIDPVDGPTRSWP